MKKDNRYKYPVKLDKELKKPLKDLAKETRYSINDIINFAVEHYIKLQKEENTANATA